MVRPEVLEIVRNHFPGAIQVFLFFLGGYLLSAVALRLRLEFLKILPQAFLKLARPFVDPQRSIGTMASFIFLFNGISIFVYMLVGVIPALPLIIAAITGLHIGLLVAEPESFEHHIVEEHEVVVGLLPFVALLSVPALELIVFSFSLAMGVSGGVTLGLVWQWAKWVHVFLPRIEVYLLIGIPILLAAAWLEAIAIKELARPPEENI